MGDVGEVTVRQGCALTRAPRTGRVSSRQSRRNAPRCGFAGSLRSSSPRTGEARRGCRARSSWAASTGCGALVIGSAPRLRLREGDHLADVLLAGQDRHQPVDAERRTRRAAGRRSWNGLRKNPNLRSASSSLMPSSGEDPPLQLRLVDPDRARAELPAVEHEVVGLRRAPPSGRSRAGRRRRGAAWVNGWWPGFGRPVPRRRRRTSGSRRPTRSGTGPRAPAAGRGRCAAGRAPRTWSSTRRRRSAAGRPARPRAAGAAPPARRRTRNLATGDSSAPSAPTFSHTRPLAPSCLARSVSPSSLLRPYSSASPGTRMPLIARGAGERLELGRREHVGQLDQLHPEAQVGLVDAEAVHRLVPRHPLDRRRPLPRHRLGGGEHGLADRGEHVVLVDEAHLGVELHELVLAVGAQVLVAQAAGDLVVAVDAGHHQQLLEQLRATAAGRRTSPAPCATARGTRGRPRASTARASASRPRRSPAPPSRVRIGRVDRGPDAQVALHPLAADVEVAVLQAGVLVDVVGAGVDRERRRLGGAQHLDRAVADLDLAGRQVRVDRALRAGAARRR